MSYKMYTAYRVKIKDLDEFTRAIEEYFIKSVSDRIKGWALKILNGNPTMDDLELEKFLNNFIDKANQYAANPYSIETGFTFTFYNRYVYILPYGLVQNFEEPECAEDYSYWNNTDKPDNIDGREWAARYRVWNKILDNYHGENKSRVWYEKVCTSAQKDRLISVKLIADVIATLIKEDLVTESF